MDDSADFTVFYSKAKHQYNQNNPYSFIVAMLDNDGQEGLAYA